ncbi:hypothetical protein [Paenibacillus sp. 481]|uniref:hypothetical protein n=1 Tax=Paenibacillus sp. 481 TaxID=2835869 RepID=UPI001E44DD00|nr:hypothetical protein [Paenibacillus sp. 481]UHA71940.1 hypothetical protein KIK04_14500 [Paenibacillus sp. 481]
MGSNKTVSALDAWIEHKINGSPSAAMGSIQSVHTVSQRADVTLDGEEGLIRYDMPLVEQTRPYIVGDRVLIIFTGSNQAGGVVIGRVSAG